MSSACGRRKARAPIVSKKLKETEQEKAFRKSLSILQPAADNPASLVGCSGTSSYRKIGKLKAGVDSKENSPMKLRRSKRKATVSSSEESKVKSSTPITSDKSSENADLKQQTLTKYSKKLNAKLKETAPVNQEEDKKGISEHPEASFSGISIRSGSSGYCSDGLEKPEGNFNKLGASAENKLTVDASDSASSPKDNCIAVSEELQNTPSIPRDVYDLLFSDKVPESYWEQLAERRRLALEETLHENELLRDQLEVLEAENSRLSSLVNDAEKLADMIKDMLDEP